MVSISGDVREKKKVETSGVGDVEIEPAFQPTAIPSPAQGRTPSTFRKIISAIGSVGVLLYTFTLALWLYFSRWLSCCSKRKQEVDRPPVVSIGFLHPFCNAGGGGERVLWCFIKAIELHLEALNSGKATSEAVTAECVIYSQYDPIVASHRDILHNVRTRFGIEYSNLIAIKFIDLLQTEYLAAKRYPRFTMLGQSAGSVILAAEALSRHVPDIFVDTTGLAFSYPLAAMAGCDVVCYTHYPTISSDMLHVVKNRVAAHNNDDRIAKSQTLSYFKYVYYRAFSWLYAAVGRYATVILVNGTWTRNHIAELWRCEPVVIFPPCDTACFQKFPILGRQRLVVSIAQFRPEKNHELQLRSFKLFKELGGAAVEDVTFIVMGSVRFADDHDLLMKLKSLAVELGISDTVSFAVNVTYPKLQEILSHARAGMHSMWNEHFGIGVVEMMAAGVVTIGHNSGGPRFDIITVEESPESKRGYLASSPEQYAKALLDIFAVGGEKEAHGIALRGRKAADEFSQENFYRNIMHHFAPLLESKLVNARKSVSNTKAKAD